MVDIPCGEWLPDRATLGVPVSVAKNVIPWVDGYKSFPALSVISSNALTAKFQGGYFARDMLLTSMSLLEMQPNYIT